VAGSEAAGATQNATNASISEQQSALNQQATLAAPYTGLGQAAIPQYENLLGIGTGGASGIQSALAQTPGYQFTQQQGETGILNAASAQGGVGGNTLAALDQYNTGLAQGTYQQQLGDLQGAVGLGQAAAAGQASNIGTAAGNIGSALINQGQTTAGIDSNVAAGLTKAASGAVNQGIEAQTIGALNAQSSPGISYAGGGGGFNQLTSGNGPTQVPLGGGP
jgi:hypothetical protein